jgi:TonB family protein
MRILLRTLALTACVALAIAAGGGESDVAKLWLSTLNDASALLRAGNHDTARKRLEHLLDDMLKRIVPGEQANRLLAVVIANLAIAEAGGGDERDAIWHWQVAQSIYPAIRGLDLSPYGAPGELLRANVLGTPPEKCAQRPLGTPIPNPIKRVEPLYPEGPRQLRQSGIIIVQLRIDALGRPIEPFVLKSFSTPVTYTALDALRQWRYELPKADDPLKDAPFCTTFNFKLVK